MQTEKGEFLDTRHQIVARRLNSGMQGDCKCELLRKLSEALDARDDAACGNREVPCANAEATVRVIQLAQSGYGIVEVGERLSLAHENNARDAFAEISRDIANLVDHFLGSEGSGETRKTCGAERATHGAAGLRGYADGEFVPSRHADRFNGGAVGKLEKVFAGAVFRNLFGTRVRVLEREPFLQLIAKSFGYVSHLIERTDVLNGDPIVELLPAKRRLA